MKKIEAKIVADSISPQGHRITSMLLTYPRFIHGEIMTHRMFSRNSASSRAIPFEKMVKSVEEDPFIPIAWQKDHKGMQGNDYIQTDDGLYVVNKYWLEARDKAVKAAKDLHSCNITKQLCNRLLEPFMWHTTLCTFTESENFFNLRCPKYHYEPENKYFRSKRDFLEYAENAFGSHIYIKDEEWRSINSSQAEIHIQALAEAMWNAMNESTPKQLKAGEWHIPFGDYIDEQLLSQTVTELYPDWFNHQLSFTENIGIYKIKIATARCARLSFMTFEGEINYKKDLGLHDKLFIDKHKSPFEHCAKAMSDEEYFSFFKGKYPTGKEDSGSIFNYEVYANVIEDDGKWIGFTGVNPKMADKYGWCNNFRGWIPYRYLII